MIAAEVEPLKRRIEQLEKQLNSKILYSDPVKMAGAQKILGRSNVDITRRIQQYDEKGRPINKGLIKKAKKFGAVWYFDVNELQFIKANPHLWNQPHLW